MALAIGDDIKEVIAEVGLAFSIMKEADIITGEFLDYTENTQMTKPFTFQHFLEVKFYYDTLAAAGDVVRFDVDGRKYLIMSALPELFENEIIETSAMLYRCNTVGSLVRPSGETEEEYSYANETQWLPIKAGFPCLLTDKLYGTALSDEKQQFTMVDTKGLILYAPAYVKPLPQDRFIVSGEGPYRGALSGEFEYYRVTAIESHSFDGVSVVYLEEDTRP